MSNRTNIMGFVLLGFPGSQELHITLFLIMYLFDMVGNLLIIVLIAINKYLHTPMYFFLINLSIGDLAITTSIIPKSIVNAFVNSKWISYSECVTQLFFYVSFLSSNFFILTAMAYDRYIAICHPLHFTFIMKWSTCMQMAGGAWVVGFLHAALHTGNIFSMPFCSNIINQFFCEVPQLIKLFCPGSYLGETWILIFSSGLEIGCLSFIILSYVRIFTTVLRMPSIEKREKAFSTCIPHLIVVSLLVGSSLLAHLILPANSPSRLDQVFTTLYAIVPSLMNPIIYSMRNKDVINQFFCEVPQLIKLFCPDFYLGETWVLVFGSGLGVGCLSFIILSYVRIFSTVLRMPSAERREKAFSTCIPHLIVVSVFIGSSLLAHLVLPANSPSRVDEIFTVLYTLVPSLMNPIIYSMRNKAVKTAFWKFLGWGNLSKK